MNVVLRQEKKIIIPLDQYYLFSRRLEKIMKEDKHSSGDGYMIRSLYFDTIDDNDYEDKINGVEIRRKIRLRSYGPETPFAMLEMKQKQGVYQQKRSLKMDREDAGRMAAGDYSALLKYEQDFALECFGLMNTRCYRPRTVITYTRKAFVAKENSIRVTFDHHIKATESNFDIFKENLQENIVFDPYLVVMEVKFNGFLLSYIKDMLNQCYSTEKAVSKYCLGRTVGKNYLF